MNQLMQDFHDNFFELVGGSIAAGHHFLFASADHGLLLGIMRSMAIGMGTAYGIRTLNFITTFFITSIKSITMKQLLAFFTFLVVIATTLQGFVPQLPITDPNTAKYISAGLLFAVLVFTSLKQFATAEISNASLWPTVFVTLIAIIGGLNDFFKVLPLDPHTSQWVRFGLTFSVAVLNVSSTTFFPSATSVVIGFILLAGLSGCTISKQQSVLRGACTTHEFNTYTKVIDTTAGLPAALAGIDSGGVYVICNTQEIVHNYPKLGQDIVKARSVIGAWIMKLATKK